MRYSRDLFPGNLGIPIFRKKPEPVFQGVRPRPFTNRRWSFMSSLIFLFAARVSARVAQIHFRHVLLFDRERTLVLGRS